MKTVGAYEEKIHLSKLLRCAAEGETITITKQCVPVAKLLAADPAKIRSMDQVIELLWQFRRTHRLGGLSIREMIEQGRS